MNNDIVLIQPGVNPRVRHKSLSAAASVSPPLGLVYLGSFLQDRGYNVQILDGAQFDYNLSELINQIKKIEAKYIGISSTTLEYQNAKKIISEIKERSPNATIIGGGVHFSFLPVECLKENPGLNFIIKGEGELALHELIKRLDACQDVSTLKGIYSRETKKGEDTEYTPIVELNHLPDMNWSLIKGDLNIYKVQLQSGYGKSMTLMTSRGCPGKCIFCSNHISYNKVRLHSADYVFRQIDYLHNKYGFNHIQFEDDNFFLLRKRNEALFQKLIDSNYHITWSCVSRVDTVNYELLKSAKKAGCISIMYGIETADDMHLKKIGKNITIKQVKEAIDVSKKAGIRTKGFFIVGLPYETKEVMDANYNFIKTCGLDDISISYFTPFPGSWVYPEVEKHGVFLKEWNIMNKYNVVFIPNGLSAKMLHKQMSRCFFSFYFRKKAVIQYIKRKPNLQDLLKTIKAALGLGEFLLKELYLGLLDSIALHKGKVKFYKE